MTQHQKRRDVTRRLASLLEENPTAHPSEIMVNELKRLEAMEKYLLEQVRDIEIQKELGYKVTGHVLGNNTEASTEYSRKDIMDMLGVIQAKRIDVATRLMPFAEAKLATTVIEADVNVGGSRADALEKARKRVESK